ncbi:MAG: LCP family protein, partial [Porcipelethomonas sp.]
MGRLTKFIIGLLITLLIIFIIYSVVVMMVISKVKIVETGERIAPSHSLYDSSDVRNILLIGSDSRGEDTGRSDSMILLSLNSSTDKINMVSLMRDTYVQVPGYGGCKLNAAYAYGGPELLMDTIEENFYIEVDDYISVNFLSFAGIVDAVGGVEVEVNADEAAAINVLLDSKEGVSLFGEPEPSDYLDGAGTYELNGKQALCYARLRKVGNADFERTERQRTVLTGILKNLGPSSIFSVIGEAIPNVSTNMSKLDMYLLSLRLPFLLGYDIEQLRIPAENTYWDSMIDGQDVLEIDIDANLDI